MHRYSGHTSQETYYVNLAVSAVQGNKRCLFLELYETNNTLCGQKAEFYLVVR
jgi:hypothetical protein